MSLAYTEYVPSPDLANVVDNYWSMTSTDAGVSIAEQLVSVNPGVEIFFNLGAPYRRRDPSAVESGGQEVRGSHLVGFRVKPVLVSQPGPVRVFAARCKPEGIAGILPFRLGTAIHEVVPIDEIWGAKAGALEDALFESKNDRTRINLVESYLRELLNRRERNSLETTFFSLLRLNGGAIPISQIALETGADYKRIERSFLRTVGVTPKFYARVLRYQKAAEDLLRAPSDTPWLDAGFSDQAHFIREFSEFTGLSPIRFLKGAQEISRWLLE